MVTRICTFSPNDGSFESSLDQANITTDINKDNTNHNQKTALRRMISPEVMKEITMMRPVNRRTSLDLLVGNDEILSIATTRMSSDQSLEPIEFMISIVNDDIGPGKNGITRMSSSNWSFDFEDQPLEPITEKVFHDDNEVSPSSDKVTDSKVVLTKILNKTIEVIKKRNSRELKLKQTNPQISIPTENDILLGRGGKTNNHFGNKRYRDEVKKMKTAYTSCMTKQEKFNLSKIIVRRVSEYGGRFLKQVGNTDQWYVIDEFNARKKASQALRESK